MDNKKILCIGPDEFRDFIPGYIRVVTYLFHSAVSITSLMQYTIKLCHKKQNFIFDGTLVI